MYKFNRGLLLTSILLTAFTQVASAIELPTMNPEKAKITIIINDKPLALEEPPVVESGRVLVPLRAIFEALGADVKWDASTKSVYANIGNDFIELKMGERKAVKNRLALSLDVPAQLSKGRAFVPLRFVAEAFGSKVGWDRERKIVSIDSKGASIGNYSLLRNNSELSLRSTGFSTSSLQNVISPLLGIPYRFGGGDIRGFDCSGFTSYVMKQIGIKLPRSSTSQYSEGTNVYRQNLSVGDLLFFSTEKDGVIDHVGIYMGNNKMAHAALKEVKISDLDWYYKHYQYIGARRVLNENQKVPKETKEDNKTLL